MNSHLSSYEREFFLLRIVSGILRYGKLEIRSPDINTLQHSAQIYLKIYKKCLNNKILTVDEMTKSITDMNLWTDEDQDTFEILPTRIEDFKVQMFDNILRPLYQDKVRVHLNSCKDQLDKLLIKKHKFDYLTCEGVSHFAKWQYIISNSIYYKNKKYRGGNRYSLLDYYYKNNITEDQIRKICQSQPWSSYWSSRESCQGLFNKPSTELTSDQVRLIYWSSVYDQVYEQNDIDPKSLVEDNDVFDGWLITKSRERKSSQKASFIKNPKIANAQNVFLAASTKEEAKEIYNMNSPRAKQTFMERVKRIKQEGEVAHKDFKDVQLSRYEK